ncbi:MAG: ABC transporter ATP-binding protein [Thermoleophilaceae bacterium]|nr:ABC transporter ATP-binding protein [Thermoleophilaceae bacterium]
MEHEVPVVELRNVRKTFGSGTAAVEALKGLNFEARPDRMTAIVGPSGSGKSTLLNLIGGLDTPTSGKIFFQGRDLSGMTESERTRFRARNIGFVFQFLNLLPGLTCAQNVTLGGVIVGMAPREARSRAVELLEVVGLADKTHKLARELSGGQMQRVAIARALINDAPLLLADEPTGNLDERNAEEITALLQERATDGRAVILVTHNDALAQRYADDVKTVRDGRVLEDEPPEQIPNIAELAAVSSLPLPAAAVSPTVMALGGAGATTFELEIGPVGEPDDLLALQRTIEDCGGGSGLVRLVGVDQRNPTFSVPSVHRDQVIAHLALRLASENGGVHVRETADQKVVFELKDHSAL